MDTDAVGTRRYTVAEFAAELGRQLRTVFADDIYVEGEVSGLNRSARGHVYFDLIEPKASPDHPPAAQLPVALWSSNKVTVNKALRRAKVGRIEDGMRVRVRAAVDFYEAGGRLQLRMTGIDPTYTLAHLTLERDELRRRLLAEGLDQRQQVHSFPDAPLRIGLVTGEGSAAEADFMVGLEQSGLAWTVLVAHSLVQGPQAAEQIVAAIRRLERRRVELIAVVRGGGSRVDLAVFDSELVARAIAEARVPVITGIGHEVDASIADDVAHRSYKTPTACASSLVEAVAEVHGRAERSWSTIVAASEVRLTDAESELRAAAQRCGRDTRAMADRHDERLRAQAARAQREGVRATARASTVLRGRQASLGAAAATRLHEGELSTIRATGRVRRLADRPFGPAENQLETAAIRLAALDPRRALARGWSITSGPDGAVVRAASQLSPGDELHTLVADGRISSRVEGVTTSETEP